MMRIDNAITTLVGGEELEGEDKWSGPMAAPNGSLYGIPSRARRVAKFNPVDRSITEIGPDFGGVWCKWSIGAMTENGIIYCPPCNRDRGILKIDTNTDTVTDLDANLLPEQGDGFMWESCAAALDGCIYFIPCKARRIMKLDPNNGDAMSSVGDNLGDGASKYIGTVIGIDGCVYGIPFKSKRILKYDPINDITSFVGEACQEFFQCTGNGTLGRDGCIYALANVRLLKIDTANNLHRFVENSVLSDNHRDYGWLDAILGIDGCIYWAPFNARRTLKYDPHSDQTSLVGDDFGIQRTYSGRWYGGSLATDGVIYCIPNTANQVLAIDPLGEFSLGTKTNMEEHPEELGFLFRINGTDTASNRTNFDSAVTKFGVHKVFEIVQKCLPPANEVCVVSRLYPFMIAASYKESPLSVIYFLLRQVPSLITCNSAVGSVHCELKRKRSIS